jgi:hypothetical protein
MPLHSGGRPGRQGRDWFAKLSKRPLTRPATAGESAGVGHAQPKGRGWRATALSPAVAGRVRRSAAGLLGEKTKAAANLPVTCRLEAVAFARLRGELDDLAFR